MNYYKTRKTVELCGQRVVQVDSRIWPPTKSGKTVVSTTYETLDGEEIPDDFFTYENQHQGY